MIILDVEQGSDEWKAARLGRVTASRVADMTAKTKTGWGASRANYLAELVAERLTGAPAERYTNAAMEWGSENEAAARSVYEMMTDATVEQVGAVLHPSIDMALASPDGLVGTDGLVEIKCPSTATHIDTLLTQTIPDKYIKQMQFQMACTGRAWCDFVSFDPRMPGDMQLFIKRVNRYDELIAELEKETRIFLAEVDATIAALIAKYRHLEAA